MDSNPKPLVVDPKLVAPRGLAASASVLEGEGDIRLEDDLPTDRYLPEGPDSAPSTSTAEPLSEGNVGFKLLQKMGWKGTGLGKKEDGIVEPVKAGVDAGVRLGVGKQEQDDEFTSAEGISRKLLESEVQLNEDEQRTKRREMQVEREGRIKEDVSEMLRTFLCTICNKQYTNAMEMEAHLSSYDHHHKKRMAETRAAEAERTREERQKKEQKRLEREQAKLNEQFRRAQQAAGIITTSSSTPGAPASSQAAALPPPPPPAPTASAAPTQQLESSGALSEERPAIQIGLGGGMTFSMSKPGAAGGRGPAGVRGGLTGIKRPGAALGAAARSAKLPASAAFGHDSSEDDA